MHFAKWERKWCGLSSHAVAERVRLDQAAVTCGGNSKLASEPTSKVGRQVSALYHQRVKLVGNTSAS